MKSSIFIAPVLFAFNAFGQNQIQTNVSNINVQQQRYIQGNQVFASNLMGNTSNANKPIRANSNPQVQVQRATNASSNQRRQVRRVVNNVNTNVSNVIQPHIVVLENNINDDIQLQNFSQQLDNNLGNAFGNESLVEQIASVNIPAIQLGTGSLNLNLELPTIKLPSMKFASRKSVSNSKHKTHTIKKKLAKLNRKMAGKWSLEKKLRIKVDNCFKW